MGSKFELTLLSSHGQGHTVMKNWEPLVLGPAFAMDTMNGFLCWNICEFQSSRLVYKPSNQVQFHLQILHPKLILRQFLFQVDIQSVPWNLWWLYGRYDHCNIHFGCVQQSFPQFLALYLWKAWDRHRLEMYEDKLQKPVYALEQSRNIYKKIDKITGINLFRSHGLLFSWFFIEDISIHNFGINFTWWETIKSALFVSCCEYRWIYKQNESKCYNSWSYLNDDAPRQDY